MELRSGIKDKCIRDELKEYFGLAKSSAVLVIHFYLHVWVFA